MQQIVTDYFSIALSPSQSSLPNPLSLYKKQTLVNEVWLELSVLVIEMYPSLTPVLNFVVFPSGVMYINIFDSTDLVKNLILFAFLRKQKLHKLV